MTRGTVNSVDATKRASRRTESYYKTPKLELIHTLERAHQDTSSDATLRELYLTKTQLRDAKVMLAQIEQRDDLSPELRDTIIRSLASLGRIQQRLDDLATNGQGLAEGV